MQIKNVLAGVVGLAVLAEASNVERRSLFGRALERRQRNRGGNGGNGNNGGNNGGNGGTTLDANLIQTGSQQDGNNPGADGQSASATDNANFINFCQGKTLTNGEQVQSGSCNGIPMGNIPSTNNMVSSVFVNPQNGDNVDENTTFNIQVQMLNFAPGTFTNATSTYYAAPQDVDSNGNIIGHTHVTVQSTGDSLNPTQPLDPKLFVFFKGINDAGNGQGLLSATVTDGLPAGNYRLCSMSSAANHQPVLMPVAQRGAQDDCIRFTVGGNGNGNGNNGNNGQNNANNGQNNNSQNGQNGQGGDTNNAADPNNGQNGQNGQNGNTQTGQNGQTGNTQTGQNGQTGNTQTGQNGQNGNTQTGQNGQTGNAQTGQNGQTGNTQTGQNGQTGNAQNGQNGQGGRGRGGRGGRKGNGNGGFNQQAATSAASTAPAQTTDAAAAQTTDAAAAQTTTPAESSDSVTNSAGTGQGGASAANALGGIAAPPVTQSGNQDRPFEVQGNTFTTKDAANQRACDIQHNQCADAVNSKAVNGVSVGDCQSQIAACVADLAASS